MNQETRHDEMKTPPEPKTTKEERELTSKFVQRFNSAEQAVRKRQGRWKIIDTFDRGEQWEDVSLPPWVPTPILNMIKFVRTVKRANLAGNLPAAHYTSLNKDHDKLIQRLQRAYKHVWDTQKVPAIVRRCIDRSFLQGTSIGYVYSDDNIIDGEYYSKNNPKNRMYQGEIRVKRLSVTRFYVDPDATCIDDARWIDIPESTTIKAVKTNPRFREYAGDKLDTIKKGGGSDRESLQVLERDNYPGQNDALVHGEDEQIWLHSHWEMEYKEDGSKQLNVYYYLKDYDFLLYKVEDVKPSIYPFAVLYDEEEDDDFYGTATAWDILEKQKLINKLEQTASIIGTLHQNPQKVVARESGINGKDMARTGTQPGKVWVSNIDPTRSVHTLNPMDIPKGVIELKDRSVLDIKEYVGINEAYAGESVGSLTTSTGVNSLIERATIRDRDKMKQIDAFIERLSEIIVLFILEKWKEKRPIVNVNEGNGKIERDEWEPIKEVDAKNLKWFVKSNVYATSPVSQALLKQQADQLLQVQQQFQPDPPIITLKEWLMAQDFPNKHEILERIESDEEKKKQKEAMDFANIVMQMAEQMRKMLGQGMPREQVMNAAVEQARELLSGNDKKQAALGFGEQGRPRDAAQQPQTPQGMTGQAAMMNMARGS